MRLSLVPVKFIHLCRVIAPPHNYGKLWGSCFIATYVFLVDGLLYVLDTEGVVVIFSFFNLIMWAWTWTTTAISNTALDTVEI